MKRQISIIAVIALSVLQLCAQTFTATNRDGVNINYQVISASSHTVGVDTGTYTGRIVIPDTVSYNGDNSNRGLEQCF